MDTNMFVTQTGPIRVLYADDGKRLKPVRRILFHLRFSAAILYARQQEGDNEGHNG